MRSIKQVFGGRANPDKMRNDSLNNSLDTTSSMNTADSDLTKGRESSFDGDFIDCPFIGHRLYTPLKEHYKHALGLLYLAKRRDTGEKCVIKLIERGPSVTRHVVSELLLHRACCGHPLFVQLLDVFLTPQYLAIVMEYVPGGDILELVRDNGALSEATSRWLFQQLIVGIMYLHSQGASNREIKLQNKLLSWGTSNGSVPASAAMGLAAASSVSSVRKDSILSRVSASSIGVSGGANGPLPEDTTHAPMERSPSPAPLVSTAEGSVAADGLAEGITTEADSLAATATPVPSVKIQDFMYSKSEQINSDPHSALGSLPYTAPEVLNNSIQSGAAADVWALGVALFKMSTGIYPFERPEDDPEARVAVQAVLTRIATVDYVIPETLSPGLRDLLARMLVRSPTERMKLENILEHPWVKEGLSEKLLSMNADAAARFNTVAPMSEAALRALLSEAQQSIRLLDSDNVDDLADELLNEEEADDLLDELSLG